MANHQRIMSELHAATRKKIDTVKATHNHTHSKLLCKDLEANPSFDLQYKYSQAMSYTAEEVTTQPTNDTDNDDKCKKKFKVCRIIATKSSDDDKISLEDIEYRIVLHESSHITSLSGSTCQYPSSTGRPCRLMFLVALQLNWTKVK